MENKNFFFISQEVWDSTESIRESDLVEEKWVSSPAGKVRVFTQSYLIKGDYCDTGSVGKSNVGIFKEEFSDHPDVRFLHSYYGYVAVIIRDDTSDKNILEILEKLENYPLIDEDHHSQIELDMQDEAWESWIERGFITALEVKFDMDDLGIGSETIHSLFSELCSRANEYIELSGNEMWIDVDSIVEHCTLDDILDFKD